MNWLEQHAYLAPWLTPTVALLIAYWQHRTKPNEFDWRIFTIYLAFFGLTGVVLSPDSVFSIETKNKIDLVWFLSFFAILWDINTSTRRTQTNITPRHARKENHLGDTV